MDRLRGEADGPWFRYARVLAFDGVCAPEGRVLRVGRKGSQERAAALCHAPAVKAELIELTNWCRTLNQADGMYLIPSFLTPLQTVAGLKNSQLLQQRFELEFVKT